LYGSSGDPDIINISKSIVYVKAMKFRAANSILGTTIKKAALTDGLSV